MGASAENACRCSSEVTGYLFGRFRQQRLHAQIRPNRFSLHEGFAAYENFSIFLALLKTPGAMIKAEERIRLAPVRQYTQIFFFLKNMS
jgi:hypothetical protein